MSRSDGLGGRAGRMGMIVPFDFVLDRECWEYVPTDASLHITRLPHIPLPYGVEHARALVDPDLLATATGSLTAIDPAVVIFSCTSASFVDGLLGERRIVATLRAAGARRALTTSGAILEALACLGTRRLAIASPYMPKLGDRLRAFIEAAGVTVAAQVDLNLLDFEAVAATPADQVTAWAAAAAHGTDADAVFLPGTNLPTIDMIAPAEHRLGIPVLTANQVTMWAGLRAAGLMPPLAVADQRLFRAAA